MHKILKLESKWTYKNIKVWHLGLDCVMTAFYCQRVLSYVKKLKYLQCKITGPWKLYAVFNLLLGFIIILLFVFFARFDIVHISRLAFYNFELNNFF